MSPKDEKIINKDDSVTNDADMEKGEQETVQEKPDEVRVPTVTPDNDSGEPGPPAVDKGNGPQDENI